MRLDDFRVCVRPGEGLVARFPQSVLAVTASDWAAMPAVDRLLEECRRASHDRPLAQRLAELVDEVGAHKVPAFCALADDGDGLALFVHGDSQVVITGAQPVMRLSGHRAGGWTGAIHDRVASLIFGPAAGAPEAAPSDNLVDLRDGIVPGGAILLMPREEVSTGPRPDAGSPVFERRASPDGGSMPATEADQPGDPLPDPGLRPPVETPPTPAAAGAAVTPAFSAPLAAPPAAPPAVPDLRTAPVAPGDAVPAAAVDGTPVMVWGIHCKRGHFNNPDARYCRMCGTHMVHQRRDPVLGPRPVLGFLIVDDGSTYKLDADYVVGLEPEADDSVRAGEARGLSLSDPENTVSAVHAAVHLEKWNVFLRDMQSRYGTHIWTPGSSGWVRLDPGQKVMLEPRSHLLFGRRTIVFDSVHRR